MPGSGNVGCSLLLVTRDLVGGGLSASGLVLAGILLDARKELLDPAFNIVQSTFKSGGRLLASA